MKAPASTKDNERAVRQKKEQGSRPNPSTVEPSKKSSSTGPDWSEEDVRNKAS